jgi:hypothetical protein
MSGIVDGPWPTEAGTGEASRAWTAEQVLALGVCGPLTKVGSILGIGRTKSYELARHGAFPVPVIKAGDRYVVPMKPVLELLGIPIPAAMADAPAAKTSAA